MCLNLFYLQRCLQTGLLSSLSSSHVFRLYCSQRCFICWGNGTRVFVPSCSRRAGRATAGGLLRLLLKHIWTCSLGIQVDSSVSMQQSWDQNQDPVWVSGSRLASGVVMNKDKGVFVLAAHHLANQGSSMHTGFSLHVCRFDEDINQSCHSSQLTSGSGHPLRYMIAPVL